MSKPMLPRRALMAGIAAGTLLLTAAGAARAQDAAPMISADARNAVEAMGKTLSGEGFAFHDRTIREYVGANGQPLHIFHSAEVVVRRPDRLSVAATGDDGATRMAYDGKDLVVYSREANKYASFPVTGGIEDALKAAAGRMGVDFPLADLVAVDPAKAFLADVSAGWVVNKVPVDGVPCQHLLFNQPPGIELELWVENNDRALPRRLIVTYRSLPGEPRFIAEMSDWTLGTRPADDVFSVQIPAGATKIELGKDALK